MNSEAELQINLNQESTESRKWYVLYTKSRSEKKVNERLMNLGFETYLPLKKAERKWSDRRKVIEVPLINSYIFVYIRRNELYTAVALEGVVRYLSFHGQAATIRQKEIDILKTMLEKNIEIDIEEGVPKVGKKIKFTSGIFKDYEGTIVNISKKKQVAIEILSLGKTLIVNTNLKNFLAENA